MPEPDKQQRLQEAQHHQAHQEWTEAIACYQQILDDYGEDPDIYHVMSILYAQQAQYASAIKQVKRAIQIDARNPTYFNSLGIIQLKQRQWRKAISAFKDALALKPDYAIAYNNLGKCYYEQHRDTDAETAYRQALHHQPHYLDANINLAICLTRKTRYEEAIPLLTTAIEHDPNRIQAYNQLAEIYLQQEQYADAIPPLQERLKRDPKHEDSWHRLGLAYLHTHQPEFAAEAFEHLLALNSQHPEANQLFAHAQVELGDQEKALSFYFRQLAIEPSIQTLFNIGVIMMNQQRHKDAIPYLTRVTQEAPDYLPAWINLGAIYLKIQTPDKALRCYQHAQKLAPNDIELKHILSALSEGQVAPKAPATYTTHLFDQYAGFYDTHLTQHLAYSVPDRLNALLNEECGDPKHDYHILDLGCGTGLCGPILAPYARSLIGIDLSEKMATIARAKGCYTTVLVGDIETLLTHPPDQTLALDPNQTLTLDQVDLMLAADVLPYYGDCRPLFQCCYDHLVTGGYFIFSFEKAMNSQGSSQASTQTATAQSAASEPSSPTYVLHQNIRYAHYKSYIESCLAEVGFSLLRFDNCVLRQQYKKPVEGYLVMVKKLNVN